MDLESAKDIPRFLFEKFRSEEIGDVSEMVDGGYVFPIKNSSGYIRFYETGNCLYFEVGDMIIHNFFARVLTILAGPLGRGDWVPDKGYQVFETVTARISYDFRLDSPIAGIVIDILGQAYSLFQKFGVREYWEQPIGKEG